MVKRIIVRQGLHASTIALGFLAVLGTPGRAQVTQRLSLDSNGAQANRYSLDPSISADGRFITFYSSASNLVPGDSNGAEDVFARDRLLGTTERVSVSSSGVQGNGYSYMARLSSNGRFVAFESGATNLVALPVGGYGDVYVRDLWTGTTELVSIGAQPGDFCWSTEPTISSDGRYVAFSSSCSLAPAGTNNLGVYVRDRRNATTERVGVGWQPSISGDGEFVAYTNGGHSIVVYDRSNGSFEIASRDSYGTPANGASFNPSISADGRWVAFASNATNLVPGDTNALADVFVHDRSTGRTHRVSVDSRGTQAEGASYLSAISADGRYVAIESEAPNLVPGDTNQGTDVFVHDRFTGATERVNLEPSGAQAHYGGGGYLSLSISADGRFIAFANFANDLVAGDTNHEFDIFVRDRSHAPFESVCEPGRSGVVTCPCSNPPSGPERGCDNSSASGGASLWLAGGEYLSSDTIVFTATGAIPHGLGIVLQGASILATGATYGQGVRCIAGSWKRLYVLIAQEGGRMSGPVILAGQPMVHERSAALGDVILAGSTRWYMIAYRDAIVLGGCPATSTLNATQAREVTWLP